MDKWRWHVQHLRVNRHMLDNSELSCLYLKMYALKHRWKLIQIKVNLYGYSWTIGRYLKSTTTSTNNFPIDSIQLATLNSFCSCIKTNFTLWHISILKVNPATTNTESCYSWWNQAIIHWRNHYFHMFSLIDVQIVDP